MLLTMLTYMSIVVFLENIHYKDKAIYKTADAIRENEINKT